MHRRRGWPLIRLFISLELPEPARERIVRICGDVPGARWVEPDQLHLTLRFIGEVDGHVAGEIHDALGQIEAPCFALQLRGVGHFPPRSEPRALWVGILKNEGLVLLRNRIESALVRIGLPPERRKFAPHVTVARLKGSPERAVGSFLARNALFWLDPIRIDGFHLYSSNLTAKQAVHRCEATYALLGASPEEEEVACSRPVSQR